jgi:hypothetical protein
MAKKSKLQEKAVRMPDVRQAKREQVISEYLESVQAQQSEPAKSQRFLLLLYLAAILNAPLIDRLIKPMQARGLWGPRHICKKVLELPIPRFDPSKEAHLKLAELGRACTQKVADWLGAGGPGKVRSIGKLRSMVREMLAEELGEIDELVEPMLRAGA